MPTLTGANAATPPVEAAAPGSDRALWLRFEGPWPAAAATLAESDLRTAFNRRGLEVGRADDAGRRPLLTITVDGDQLEHIVLVLQAPPDVPVIRRLDLLAFPPDGRVLALVVAADELLAAASDQGRWRKPASTPAPPPPTNQEATKEKTDMPPVPAVVQAAPPPPEARTPERFVLSAGFAFEHFSGGQTHLGPTLTGRYHLGDRWFVSLAADGRQGRAITTPDRQVTSRLLGGRVAAGARLRGGDALTVLADAGVRAGRLWFDGRPVPANPEVLGSRVGTWSVVSDLMVALEARPSDRSPVSFRLSAGVGVPLLAQVAADPTTSDPATSVTAASGMVFESQAGIGLHF